MRGKFQPVFVLAQTATVVLAIVVASTPALGKGKGREWRTGKLVSIDEGTPENIALITGNPTSIVGASSQCRNWTYTVETESMVYVFSAHTGAWCADHPRPFTVGKEVKFIVERKGKAILLDEEGKEFRAPVVKKTAKQPAQ